MLEQFDHCPYHYRHNRGNKVLCVKHSKTIRRKDQTLHLLQPIITPDKSTQIEFFVSTKTWNDLKPPTPTKSWNKSGLAGTLVISVSCVGGKYVLIALERNIFLF